ncbi:MAG TPA: hypothetical protein VK464_13115 [Symbiobacteriaceae bacterium]|jgi:hypothetical protein|nr:hypothetical protein [Symbiobacteriaceae bacterium]
MIRLLAAAAGAWLAMKALQWFAPEPKEWFGVDRTFFQVSLALFVSTAFQLRRTTPALQRGWEVWAFFTLAVATTIWGAVLARRTPDT